MEDTPKLLHVSWNDVEAEPMTPLLVRQYVSGECITVARVQLKKGAVVAEHSHHNEQATFVLEGSLRLRFPDREVTLRPGEILCIPPNLPHQAVAPEDCSISSVRRGPIGWQGRMPTCERSRVNCSCRFS